MAIITKMPQLEIISGLKGTLDYYYWMGIPVCRSWPKSPGHRRSPAVMVQWPAWSYAAKEWSQISPTVQAAYHTLAVGSGLSARDMQVRAYLTGLYRYPHP